MLGGYFTGRGLAVFLVILIIAQYSEEIVLAVVGLYILSNLPRLLRSFRRNFRWR